MMGQKGEEGERAADGVKGDAGLTGVMGQKGQPGPRGLPGIPQLASSSAVCLKSSEGLMRYNQQWKGIEYCDGSDWQTLMPLPGSSAYLPASSCKDVATKYRSVSKNGHYWIKPSLNDPAFQAYCDASEGWTLIMKLNGNNQNFAYGSTLWSNKETFQANNLALDDTETKLASYWTLQFTELRLGMNVAGTTRWITISYSAPSLYSLIADGQYRRTGIGEGRWRSLFSRSSLQSHCNKEGFNSKSAYSSYFNSHARARLGFIANEQNECNSPDSFVGFGTSYKFYGITNSAGNYARANPDNGNLNIKAIGYIMAR